ncbi:MAG: hypothetical protein IJP48_11400 [Synergistaceae bacterium]|nr:hypothetical protein [Synergistaceae bacterium]
MSESAVIEKRRVWKAPTRKLTDEEIDELIENYDYDPRYLDPDYDDRKKRTVRQGHERTFQTCCISSKVSLGNKELRQYYVSREGNCADAFCWCTYYMNSTNANRLPALTRINVLTRDSLK